MSKSSWLLLLGLCASGSALAASSESAFLAQHGLAGKTVEQIVDTIDQTPQSRPLPYSASITIPNSNYLTGADLYATVRRQILSLFCAL